MKNGCQLELNVRFDVADLAPLDAAQVSALFTGLAQVLSATNGNITTDNETETEVVCRAG